MGPEDDARKRIDKMLCDSGWNIQDYNTRNLSAKLGVAVREYPLGQDTADYVLFIGGEPVGVVEAKRVGHTLSGVVVQSDKYIYALHKKFPNTPMKPSISYETTGIETMFVDRRDPNFRSRHVFTFHRPELLQQWLIDPKSLRARLKDIPALDYDNLWECQKTAIINLEESFSKNHPRALIQMATGSGKTFTAVNSIYRLIKFAKAKRILFLVDRSNLGRQAYREFQQFQTPDDGRKFTDLYNVQQLQSNVIDSFSQVVICTIQRMFSVLKGDDTYQEEDDEFSSFESANNEPPIDVQYNPNIPIGEFDFIIIDECHRSIYKKWKQVLDYFDSFLIGLTATPSNDTLGFFKSNQVMRYTHEMAIVDDVNVGYHVYQIKTKRTTQGGILESGQFVETRDRYTREQECKKLDEDFIYKPDHLDRSIVVYDQIRLVIKTFKEKLPEIFPNRIQVPKTLIFAKNDSHAEDITKIVREVFGEGNPFCKKITYRTEEKPENLIAEFRNSPFPRIAVTVDMMSTGTDVKPLECIIFMRDVKSKNYFDQMKGRGTRTINRDDLISVTHDATTAKTHFVIVDAVGVCEYAHSDTHSMSRKFSESFISLLNKAVDKNADVDDISSLIYRLSRLNKKLTISEKDEIAQVNDGKSLLDIQKTLLDGIDPDKRLERAKNTFNTPNPTDDQIKTISQQMIKGACMVFDSATLRKTILDIKKKHEQIIDEVTIDELLKAGFIAEVKERDELTIESWTKFIEENRDQIAALDIIYSKPYKMRQITFSDIKKLANAIEKPPYNLTPTLLWDAYMRLDKSKVKNNPEKQLTDLISLVRYSTGKPSILLPFSEVVDEKFNNWLISQESKRRFTPEQIEWMSMIKGNISSSISIGMDALDDVPFNLKGGRMKFHKIFGDEYESILEELHEVLINQ